MTMNIIMAATMWPTMLIMYFVFRYFTLQNNEMIFGVRLPKEIRELASTKEEIAAVQAACKREFRWLLIPILFFPGVCFLTKHVSIQFSLWMLWFLGCIVIQIIPFIRGNKKILALKQSKVSFSGTDDDQYWKFGMFYNNPNDKNTLVTSRFGIGTTTNMATKVGKFTIFIAVVSLVWIPFFCAWMIMEDFTPMRLVLEDQQIICQHVKKDYVIPLEEITNAELLDELPERRNKVSGTSTDTMEKGKFEIYSQGKYNSFVNPEAEAFLKIETGTATYIISGQDASETKQIYEAVRK